MSRFQERVEQVTGGALRAGAPRTVQVNVGLRCNLCCAHCHLGCSPARTEQMSWETMAALVPVAAALRPVRVDLTGGAPELNPSLGRLIAALRAEDLAVQVRTNLTVFFEPGMAHYPALYAANGVALVASMPCYLEPNVTAQRGAGVYARSVAALRSLNALGYGVDPALPLDLVYNPGGAFLAPDQGALEQDYRRELLARHGVRFSRLLTLANIPLGRFAEGLGRLGRAEDYHRLLCDAFNPATLEGLMCRHQISVGHDGAVYDCDFNLALGLPCDPGGLTLAECGDPRALTGRRVITGDHCFACTAGAGSSCGGALA